MGGGGDSQGSPRGRQREPQARKGFWYLRNHELMCNVREGAGLSGAKLARDCLLVPGGLSSEEQGLIYALHGRSAQRWWQHGWTEGKELQPYSGIDRLAEISRWILSLMGFARALLSGSEEVSGLGEKGLSCWAASLQRVGGDPKRKEGATALGASGD